MEQVEPSKTPITLDQLIALNDEIRALVRAGVPLERGLYALGKDMPGRLGEIAQDVARRLQQGASLSQALAERAAKIPPVYRAVIEAGARSGRLPAALESVAATAQRLASARRMVLGATIYPLLVLLLAWGLFVFFTAHLAPRLVLTFAESAVPGENVVARMAQWGESAAWWGPGVPLVVIAAVGAWWIASSRALIVDPRTAGLLLGWVPWTGSILRWAANATFAQLLALLIENGVPLHEAIRLAAEGAGDRRILAAARCLADAIRQGDLTSRRPARGALGPLLDWLILTGQQRGALLPAVQLAAEEYGRRAMTQAELARAFLPMTMTIAIGGTATLLFALVMCGPWFSLLHRLANP